MYGKKPPPPPYTGGIRNSKGKGVQEEVISKGVELDSHTRYISRDFETRIIVSIDHLTLYINS